MTFYVICHVFLLYAKLAPNVLMVGRKIIFWNRPKDKRRRTEDRAETRRTDLVPDLSYSFFLTQLFSRVC